jgi:hypothetical protein
MIGQSSLPPHVDDDINNNHQISSISKADNELKFRPEDTGKTERKREGEEPIEVLYNVLDIGKQSYYGNNDFLSVGIIMLLTMCFKKLLLRLMFS